MWNSDIKPLTSFPKSNSVSWGNYQLSTWNSDSTVDTSMSSCKSSVLFRQFRAQAKAMLIKEIDWSYAICWSRLESELSYQHWYPMIFPGSPPSSAPTIAELWEPTSEHHYLWWIALSSLIISPDYLADYLAHGVSSGPFQPSRVSPFSPC